METGLAAGLRFSDEGALRAAFSMPAAPLREVLSTHKQRGPLPRSASEAKADATTD
jgi:hypothetical protein